MRQSVRSWPIATRPSGAGVMMARRRAGRGWAAGKAGAQAAEQHGSAGAQAAAVGADGHAAGELCSRPCGARECVHGRERKG